MCYFLNFLLTHDLVQVKVELFSKDAFAFKKDQ